MYEEGGASLVNRSRLATKRSKHETVDASTRRQMITSHYNVIDKLDTLVKENQKLATILNTSKDANSSTKDIEEGILRFNELLVETLNKASNTFNS